MTATIDAPTTAESPLQVVESASLEKVWSDTPGIAGFLTTVDHKRIGLRYMVTSLAFLLVGGAEALLLRSQLAQPNSGLLGPEAFNQLMTMHGTTMILLFNTPMFAAFGNYLLPLQIGTRDMAFPRLNALSYWVFVLAGGFMYASFVVGKAPDGGWFSYTPLTSSRIQPRGQPRLLGGGHHVPRRLDHGGCRQLHRDHVPTARARDVVQPPPALRVGDPRDVLHDPLRAAGHHLVGLAPRARPGLRDGLVPRRCGG